MKQHLITLVVAVGATLGAMALARPGEAHAELMTVDGVDYPVCAYEDCSDQPNQVGLWEDKDTGDWWLSLGETSYRVVDETVTGGNK